MKVAVAGKGGVGKTTLSSVLIRMLAQRGYKVYAVDADPDASLGITLGISEAQLDGVIPLVDLKDVIKEKMGDGALYSLNPRMGDVLDKYGLDVEDNITFITMGGIKEGGSACYCRENTFLHGVMDALILDKKEAVVLDMGAGIEHLTRGTARGVDIMIIVTEPSRTSVKSVRVITRLAEQLGIKRIKVIANKIRNEMDKTFIEDNIPSDQLLGMVNYKDDIVRLSQQGKAIEGDGAREIQTILVPIIEDIG